MFTPEELELLDDALDGFMTGAYGKENDEDPAFTPEQWATLKAMETKIYCLRKIGHPVRFMYEGKAITGKVQNFRDGLVYAVSKGFMYRLAPEEIVRED